MQKLGRRDLIDRYGDRLYGAGLVRFDHGLLVIAAPDSQDEHDDWDPSVDAVHAGPDSLYISVQDSVNGPVLVLCVESPADSVGLELLFSGEIEFPSASVVVGDPNEQMRLQLPIEGRRNRVDVYGDDPDDSSEVLVVFSSIDDDGDVFVTR